jgi:hypothetical protein
MTGSSISIAGALQPQIGAQLGLYQPSTVAGKYFDYSDYSPPQSYDWKVDQILRLVAATKPNARVAILASHWVFNQDTFRYYALRMGLDGLSFYDYRDDQVQGRDGYSMLKNFNVVLEKTGNIGRGFDTYGVKEVLRHLSDPSDPFYGSWKTISTFNLPDGSQLLVFIKAAQ